MKKVLKITLAVIVLLILCYAVVLITDYTLCGNFKEPFFVIPGETADDGGSGTYHGLGYTVEMRKHIDSEGNLYLEKVEMYFCGRMISGAIADYAYPEESPEAEVSAVYYGAEIFPTEAQASQLISIAENELSSKKEPLQLALTERSVEEYKKDGVFIEITYGGEKEISEGFAKGKRIKKITLLYGTDSEELIGAEGDNFCEWFSFDSEKAKGEIKNCIVLR